MKRPVRVILYVIGAILALLAIMGWVGSMLPREHVAASTITLEAPADSVWQVVRDLGAVPSWWRDMKGAERVAGASRETWRYRDRFNSPMPLEVLDEEPYRLVLRIATEGGPFGGTWTYDVEATDTGGARATVTEVGWIANPFFRVMARTVLGYHATLDSYLGALGRRFGAEVVPTHVR